MNREQTKSAGPILVEKYDVKKELPELYAPRSKKIERVLVPELLFVAIDGQGSPDSPQFQAAMSALYSVAYTLKFRSKSRHDRDYVVGPAEGLWSADNPEDFSRGNKENWRWTLLSALPPWITQDDFEEAVSAAQAKASQHPSDAVAVLTALSHSQRLKIAEGLCLQVLHVGPYEDEATVLNTMHNEIMPAENLTFNGPHHEIYLSDPSRTDASKLRTILRQPVRSLH